MTESPEKAFINMKINILEISFNLFNFANFIESYRVCSIMIVNRLLNFLKKIEPRKLNILLIFLQLYNLVHAQTCKELEYFNNYNWVSIAAEFELLKLLERK